MREQVEARLIELRAEFEAGQTRLQQAELETARLREMLLRISGAIQVLQELLVPRPGEDHHEDARGHDAPATH